MDPEMIDLAKTPYDQGDFEGARHLEEQYWKPVAVHWEKITQ